MQNRSYSQEIAKTLDNYLSTHDWKYGFRKDAGVFEFTVSGIKKTKTVNYHIFVHDHGFTVSARYPLGPDTEDNEIVNNMVRFLTRVNYTLRNGCFEMDLDDGEIRYKIYCNCWNVKPSDEMIHESIHCPAAMFEKYGDGIMGILFGGMTDRQADEKCKDGLEGLLSRLARSGRTKNQNGAVQEKKKAGQDSSGKASPGIDDTILLALLKGLAEREAKEKAKEDYEVVE